MKYILIPGIVGLSMIFLVSCTNERGQTRNTTLNDSLNSIKSARPTHWAYQGKDGPENWASLDPVYSLCGNGKHQSPVNLIQADKNNVPFWKFNYKTSSLRIAHNEHMEEIIDNGHTIQITVEEGSTFILDSQVYYLKQFHFHTPSEHTIDGKNAPMEMHLVHKSDDGNLAVVGIFFKEGNKINENFEKIIANLPGEKGESKHLTDVILDIQSHLPNDNLAFHYIGSLTTPPCTENVQWLVLRNPIILTPEQIQAFASRIGPNNRPTQSLNDRKISIEDVKGVTN